MAKRKPTHQQKRDQVFTEMMQHYGGKSRPHTSKKDYRRKDKFQKDWKYSKGWQDQPYLYAA